ncbi:MAG TPA: glycosyl hydrolase family 8 [Polyangiaceae bacterium]|nr:glycosyl hydrolase family 8 [Polyangiaceae bacterium]
MGSPLPGASRRFQEAVPRGRRGRMPAVMHRAALYGTLLCCVVLCGALPSCRSTVDSIGYDRLAQGGAGGGELPFGGSFEAGAGGVPTPHLLPLTGPSSYPNLVKDLIGKSDEEIRTKIDMLFNRLFYGNSSTESVYVLVGEDQAYIRDVLHNDVRTEGMAWGMMICVQLDRREEFDRLYRYAKTLQVTTGPSRGYFRSFCDDGEGGKAQCLDPFGLQEILMSLIFAHGRWGSDGAIDYEADALALLELIRNKEAANGGVVDGVTNTFDAATFLPYDLPNQSVGLTGRPSITMPAYYELWHQATADPFYSRAAQSGRKYIELAADPGTGLLPVRAAFDGTPVMPGDTFQSESYRVHLNMALDRVWSGYMGDNVDLSNRILAFFAAEGLDVYCSSYSLSGECLDTARDSGLMAANAMLALVSTARNRPAFVKAMWDAVLPTGSGRYFAGVLNLIGLLVLSGQYRVY